MPFITVKRVVRSPKTLPLLPLTSSAISGFFFCGIIDEPVENASSSSTNLNSHEHHIIISSLKRERCTITSESAEASSMQKSLSETPSSELRLTLSKPRRSATIFLSSGYVVPASAPEPSGKTFMRFLTSARRSKSRRSICAYAIR